LGLEFVVLAAVVAWIAAHPPQPAETYVPLTIEVTPEPDKPAPPEVMKTVTPVPVPTSRPPKPVAAQPEPKPLPPEPVVPAVAAPQPEPVTTPTATSAPTAFTAPKPAPQVLAPAAPSVDPTLAYNVKLAAAVQAAFSVPAPAAALNFKGRTRVEFGLRDGLASNIRVVQSSGLGAADRAAIKAVETATFPPPPPSLQGKEGSYQIWVACL
jgi:protein TonB